MPNKKTKSIDISHEWKVHTNKFLEEVIEGNPSGWALKIPMRVFHMLLRNVATRASQLNDPIMNDLMCRLALYVIADPTAQEYDPKAVRKIHIFAERLKNKMKADEQKAA